MNLLEASRRSALATAFAASALLSACGGRSALLGGDADGESTSSAGGRGGEAGSGGTAGITGVAGSGGSGGNVGVAGSGPTLGAGFPICPRYDEPQICSAPGAECLDVAPCDAPRDPQGGKSGGCRRIRSICTSDYYWAPDGGKACGFACQDGPEPTTCEIDEIDGVFQGSFIEQAGDCEFDYKLSGPVPLEEGRVAFATGRCTLERENLSPDRCNLTYSVECREGSNVTSWTYSLWQLDEDGSALQGTAKLFINGGVSSCSSSYALRFDRLP